MLAFFDRLLTQSGHAVDRQIADGQPQARLAMGDKRMIEAMGLGDHLLLFARKHAQISRGSFRIVPAQSEHVISIGRKGGRDYPWCPEAPVSHVCRGRE